MWYGVVTTFVDKITWSWFYSSNECLPESLFVVFFSLVFIYVLVLCVLLANQLPGASFSPSSSVNVSGTPRENSSYSAQMFAWTQ